MAENIAMFKFGENWASFSRDLDEARIEEAMESLRNLFGENGMEDKSFLDIGCGSGLFSIAAARLGARPVLGIDADPVSVVTSENNAVRWAKNFPATSFRQLSVLDIEQMKTLGTFEIVYSWGVLHHTGDMTMALHNAAQRVASQGIFMIAIYNRHWSSLPWKFIKWLYNHVGSVGQKLLIWTFAPIIFFAKWIVTLRNPLRMERGMDFLHNIIDWVGGYPYEYASIQELTVTLESLGFEILNVFPAKVPTGCNEFVCRKKS